MGQSREEINRRYQNDLEAAKAWQEADPERYNREVAAAQDRRHSSLEELVSEAETRATASSLAAARTQAHVAYPLAPENMISGDTPEAISASAKALHELADGARKAGEEAAKAASRASRAQAYDRGGGLPASGERPPQSEDRDTERAQGAIDRINAMKAESGKNGDKRDASKILSVEDTLVAMRESGKTDHLAAVMTGEAATKNSSQERLSEEDMRG